MNTAEKAKPAGDAGFADHHPTTSSTDSIAQAGGERKRHPLSAAFGDMQADEFTETLQTMTPRDADAARILRQIAALVPTDLTDRYVFADALLDASRRFVVPLRGSGQ